MGTRLYVGNLSFDTTVEGLRALFMEGDRAVTDCVIITDRETGRSRGFGFVEMGSEDDGRKAIAALDGFELDGRMLRVSEARERRTGGGRGGDW